MYMQGFCSKVHNYFPKSYFIITPPINASFIYTVQCIYNNKGV